MGTNLSPALLGVGYIVGLNVGIVVVSGSILSFNIAIPIYHAFFLDSNPALAARVAAARTATPSAIAGAIWSAQDPLSRRRRDADRRRVDAVLAAQLAALRHQERPRRRARRQRRSRSRDTERDLPMKWMLIALVAVRDSARGCCTTGDRRQRRRRHCR